MASIHDLIEKQLRAVGLGTVMTNGGGIYQQTAKTGTSGWILRKVADGVVSVIGLGAYPAASIGVRDWVVGAG